MPPFSEEPAPENHPETFASDPLFLGEIPPRPAGHPWIAWLVIALAVAALMMVGRWKPPESAEKHDQEMSLIVFELQAKMFVGGASIVPESRPQFAGYIKALNNGSLEQRLRCVPVIGEISGPKAGLSALAALRKLADKHRVEFSARQREAFDLLEQVYGDERKKNYDLPSLNAEQRLKLQKDLGWFGTLALYPDQTSDEAGRDSMLEPARRATTVYTLAICGAGLLGFLGLIGLMLLVALVVQRQIRFGMLAMPRYGGIYAETFAVWMVLFFALSLVVGMVMSGPASRQLVGMLLTQILSLGALFWPIWRGVPQHELCRDIGLVGGPHPEREFVLGFANYAMTLPILAFGLMLTLLLMAIAQFFTPDRGAFSAPSVASHPILQVLLNGSVGQRLQIFIVASIGAPIIEEIMFRGVLYRHLREATHRFAYSLSVVASMLFTSFVFAIIHPQGIVAVPALMSIAIGLNWAREWRGSLIASIVAHGLNNGIILLLVVLMFG
ncbi:MAG TPA: type II CAAX endopeptidase family protein [Planctomycetaceae bacterium]|nr:type II CAAX endopeptidase family protein [Planctomycetaceae bacterium]